jgi:hypothetical protein
MLSPDSGMLAVGIPSCVRTRQQVLIRSVNTVHTSLLPRPNPRTTGPRTLIGNGAVGMSGPVMAGRVAGRDIVGSGVIEVVSGCCGVEGGGLLFWEELWGGGMLVGWWGGRG